MMTELVNRANVHILQVGGTISIYLLRNKENKKEKGYSVQLNKPVTI